VKLHCKYWAGAACAALIFLGTGCSGINISHSVSPLDFFLPGLLKADPPPAASDPTLPAVLAPDKAVQS
jgi:hypothetical protein